MASSGLFQNSKAGSANRGHARSSGEIFKCCGNTRINSIWSLTSSFSIASLISATVLMPNLTACGCRAQERREAVIEKRLYLCKQTRHRGSDLTMITNDQKLEITQE